MTYPRQPTREENLEHEIACAVDAVTNDPKEFDAAILDALACAPEVFIAACRAAWLKEPGAQNKFIGAIEDALTRYAAFGVDVSEGAFAVIHAEFRPGPAWIRERAYAPANSDGAAGVSAVKESGLLDDALDFAKLLEKSAGGMPEASK